MKIVKPWGEEFIVEANDHYVVKKLTMWAGQCCSLQYHEFKHETIFVLEGTLKLIVGPDKDHLRTVFLYRGQHYVIPPGLVHRMEGHTDTVYLEASTNHLDDVIRIEDKYGRA